MIEGVAGCVELWVRSVASRRAARPLNERVLDARSIEDLHHLQVLGIVQLIAFMRHTFTFMNFCRRDICPEHIGTRERLRYRSVNFLATLENLLLVVVTGILGLRSALRWLERGVRCFWVKESVQVKLLLLLSRELREPLALQTHHLSQRRGVTLWQLCVREGSERVRLDSWLCHFYELITQIPVSSRSFMSIASRTLIAYFSSISSRFTLSIA